MPEPTEPSQRGAARGRRLGQVLAPTLYAVHRSGTEHVPDEGPLVLVSNHTGLLDGPLVYCVAPRPVHFLVKRAYFRGPLGSLLRGVGQIPIVQHSGDRSALEAAGAVLRRGDVLGIFPEGTRTTGEVESAEQGAAFLALRSGAPVLPVAVLGTRAPGQGRNAVPRPRSSVSVVFGEPFVLDPAGRTGRERLRAGTEQVRDGLREHVRDVAARTGSGVPGDRPAASG